MNRIKTVFIGVIFLLSILSCDKDKDTIKKILKKAETNKVELQKFLSNYTDDTLKLKAAEFLVVGMEYRYTYDILVKDLADNSVDINLYKPKISRKNIAHLLDSLHYRVKDTIVEDIKAVKSEYLIQNLEQAFDIWQTKPWAKNYSFELFCEFILPYRIGNENLENDWRSYFQKKYLPILDTLQGNSKVNRVFQFIKNDIKKWYWFAYNTIDLKPTKNLNEVISCSRGNCIDVANVYLYTLRAIGVAATIDYIPLWGRTNYGHCELVYWDENNQAQRLKTGEWLSSPPPKVYRQYYSNQKNNLVDKVKNLNDIPPHLTERTYRDVTNEYTKTSTIIVKPNAEPKNGILYLSVFNSGRWQPIAWSDSVLTETKEFVFRDIGQNIAYLPSAYYQSRSIQNRTPLIVDSQLGVSQLLPDKDSLVSIVVSKKKASNRFYYWDKKWINIGKGDLNIDTLKFDNIPSNTLYRLGNHKERIFTYKNNKLRYW